MNYTLRIEVEVIGEATEQDVLDFIKYELGYGAGMKLDNPFIDEDDDASLEITDVDII